MQLDSSVELPVSFASKRLHLKVCIHSGVLPQAFLKNRLRDAQILQDSQQKLEVGSLLEPSVAEEFACHPRT